MSIIKSVSTATTLTFDTTALGLRAIHNLLEGAVIRSEIVRDKSLHSAAASLLTNRFSIARNLQELYRENTDLTPEALAEGDAFIATFKAERAMNNMPEPLIRFAANKAKAKAKDKTPS